ncbi:MAG: NAD kinase [Rickettsiales bacterium]|nr:NAD kinase [Rickettsiales bacterium]
MKIGVVCTQIYNEAIQAKDELIKKYKLTNVKGAKDLKNIDVLLVLGGDGFMLRTIHSYYKYNIPFFGLNYGNMGFLLNSKHCLECNLVDIIGTGDTISINPLKNIITNTKNKTFEDIAVNELTLIRSVYKTCDFDVFVNGDRKLKNYSGDGIVVSTPIGSTAYSSSLGAPIISHRSNNIILSAISPFRPRTFRNAILQNDCKLSFRANYTETRKVSAFTDFVEYKDVIEVESFIDKNIQIQLIFDKNKSLDSKIIDEQFKH